MKLLQTHHCQNQCLTAFSKTVKRSERFDRQPWCAFLNDTPADYFTEYMAAAKKLLFKLLQTENEFFAEVWQSQKDFADIAVPFWAGAQASNAGLGKAHADTLK